MKKIVPLEPTGSMVDAGMRVIGAAVIGPALLTSAWKVMVEAAPYSGMMQALTRASDPDTSVKAAERAELKLSSRRVAVLDYALYCGDKGFTDDELKVRYATGAESTYRKRRSELAQHGYLEDTGMRRLNRAGNQEIVWRITDKGRKAR